MRPHLVTALLLASWSAALAAPDAGTPFTVDASHRVRAAPLPDGAWVRLVKDTSTLVVSGPGGRKDTLTLEMPRFTAVDPRAQGVEALNQALEAGCLVGTSRQALLDELSKEGRASLTGCSFTVGLVRGPVVSVTVRAETMGAYPSVNRTVVLWSLDTGAPFSLDAALGAAHQKAFLDVCTKALAEARARVARAFGPKEWAELSRLSRRDVPRSLLRRLPVGVARAREERRRAHRERRPARSSWT